MRSRLPLIAAVLSVAALGAPNAAQAATSCAGANVVPTTTNIATVRTATICLVNKERTSRGLHALKGAESLHNVAGTYAKRMVRDQFFDHTSPDGGTFVSRIKRTTYLKGGLRRWDIGENIAWGTGKLASPAEIVNAWMHSAGHRKNILTPNYNELGMGIAVGAPVSGSKSTGATYVNEFGERRR